MPAQDVQCDVHYDRCHSVLTVSVVSVHAFQVIGSVQRSLQYRHPAVVAMARHLLDHWRWQLAGHMHVLTCPAYMEDHLGALEDEICLRPGPTASAAQTQTGDSVDAALAKVDFLQSFSTLGQLCPC